MRGHDGMVGAGLLRRRARRAAHWRRLRFLGAAVLAVFVVWLVASVAGVSRGALVLVFSAVLVPVPLLGWWVHARILDAALVKSRRAQEELSAANEGLQRTNIELQALHIAMTQGFSLIDERTEGRLRALVEEAGDDLVALVDEAVDD